LGLSLYSEHLPDQRPDTRGEQEVNVMPESADRGETSPRRRINLQLRFTQYYLPPLDSALIIGKRAPVGANGISRAFQELSPATFQLIPVEHPVAEAVLVRVSDLRKLPQQTLISRLLGLADQIMDEADTLHVALRFEVIVDEEDIEG
jgi:hypothetical protein